MFLGAVALLLLYITFGGNNINLSVIGILSSILFGYKVYKYLQHDIGSAYKIPRNKIKRIDITLNEIKIDFVNGDGINDFEIISNVGKKGISILRSL